MAALEGPTALQELLDGISTLRVPESSADRTVEVPVGAFLTSIGVAGFRGIGHMDGGNVIKQARQVEIWK